MNRQRGFAELVTLVIYGLLAAGAIAIVWSAYHSITERFRDEGRAEVRATFAPLIEQCAAEKGTPVSCAANWRAAIEANRTLAADVERMRHATNEQNAAIADADKKARDATANASRILAELARRSAATQTEIARLTTLAATPAATKEGACNEADSILRTLATRRVRYIGNDAGAGSVGADGNGSRAGPGAVHIRP